jgi:hypothetical protein
LRFVGTQGKLGYLDTRGAHLIRYHVPADIHCGADGRVTHHFLLDGYRRTHRRGMIRTFSRVPLQNKTREPPQFCSRPISRALSVSSDGRNFFYKYTRELLKDAALVKQKTWEETIPQDYQ